MYPPIVTVIHSFADIWALVWNLLVVYLVIKKTPPEIATYSVFILSLALFDFIGAICDFMLKNRFVAHSPSAIYMSQGPCQQISSFACHIFQGTMLHCYLYNLLVVVMSYIYRHFIIKSGHMQKSHLISMMFGCYMVAFIQMVVYISIPQDPHKLHVRIQELLYYENITYEDYAYYGFLDLYSDFWNVYITVSICSPCYPSVIVIIYYRRKINIFLKSKSLSAVSQKLNKQLMTALLFQSIVPMMYVYSIVCFTLERRVHIRTLVNPFATFFFYDVVFMQYYKYLVMSFMPALSPMFNIYFIKPYRETVRGWFRCKKANAYKVTPINSLTAQTAHTAPVAPESVNPDVPNNMTF